MPIAEAVFRSPPLGAAPPLALFASSIASPVTPSDHLTDLSPRSRVFAKLRGRRTFGLAPRDSRSKSVSLSSLLRSSPLAGCAAHGPCAARACIPSIPRRIALKGSRGEKQKRRKIIPASKFAQTRGYRSADWRRTRAARTTSVGNSNISTRSAFEFRQRARISPRAECCRNSRLFLLSDRATAKEGQSAKGENARRAEREKEKKEGESGTDGGTEKERSHGGQRACVRAIVVIAPTLLVCRLTSFKTPWRTT